MTKLRLYYQNGSIVNYKINYDNTSSEIDNIDINYIFKSIFSEKVNAKYYYSVTSYLHAYESDIDDVIWFRKYVIDKNKTYEVNKSNYLEIKDSVKIDYKKYNNELKEFLTTQNITGSGYLEVQIKFIDSLDGKEKITKVPKTINITIMMDGSNSIVVNNILNKDSYYKFDKHNLINFVFMLLSMLCFAASVSMIYLIVKQFKIISDRQNKYTNVVKNILSKYDYCIVKVNKLYVSKKYNMIYVDSFLELLDVYNSKNTMISYKEVKRGMESIFVIIDSNDAWIYKLTSDNLK